MASNIRIPDALTDRLSALESHSNRGDARASLQRFVALADRVANAESGNSRGEHSVLSDEDKAQWEVWRYIAKHYREGTTLPGLSEQQKADWQRCLRERSGSGGWGGPGGGFHRSRDRQFRP